MSFIPLLDAKFASSHVVWVTGGFYVRRRGGSLGLISKQWSFTEGSVSGVKGWRERQYTIVHWLRIGYLTLPFTIRGEVLHRVQLEGVPLSRYKKRGRPNRLYTCGATGTLDTYLLLSRRELDSHVLSVRSLDKRVGDDYVFLFYWGWHRSDTVRPQLGLLAITMG